MSLPKDHTVLKNCCGFFLSIESDRSTRTELSVKTEKPIKLTTIYDTSNGRYGRYSAMKAKQIARVKQM